MLKEFREERLIWNRFHAKAEKELFTVFRKALLSSIAPVIKYAENNGLNNIPVNGLVNRNVWIVPYQNAYAKQGMQMAKIEYYRQKSLTPSKASAIDFLVDIWSGILKEYALTYTYGIQRELNETTVKMIQAALGDVAELDMDRTGRLRLFIKVLKDRVKNRAANISRTEVTTLANLGKSVAAQSWVDEQGGRGYHVWLGRNDEKERPDHLHTNNTILPLEENYIVGGEQAIRPGDVNLSQKQRIRCRCTQSIMTANRYNRYVKLGRIVNGKLVGAS